jgi:O-antigen/teichoic acid export membrane protein
VAGAAASFVFSVLLLPFILERLGPALYGTWLTVSALIAVGALADGGIRTEVARRVAAAHGSGTIGDVQVAVRSGVTVMCLTAVPLATFGTIFAPALTRLVFPDGVAGSSGGDVTMLLRLMVVVTAANLVVSAHVAALRGVQRSDVEVLAQVVGWLCFAVTLVLGVFGGWGLWSLATAQLASVTAAALVQLWGMRRLLPGVSFGVRKMGRRNVLAYFALSVLALLSQVSDVLDSQWDKLVLSRFVGPEAVTAFHIGTMLVLQAKVIAVLPMGPLLAGLSELRGDRPEEARALQERLMKAGAVTAATVLGAVVLFAPAVLSLWLGPGYERAGTVARIFAVAVALNLVAAPIAFQAFAEGHHRLTAWGAALNMAVNAVVSLVLTIQVGLYGAVIGSVVGNLLGTAVFLLAARRTLSTWVPPPWRAGVLTTVVVSTLALSPVGHLGSWWPLVSAGCGVVATLGVACLWVERLSFRDVLAVAAGRP